VSSKLWVELKYILTFFLASPEVIASWPKPNYINPETRGPALLITCTTLSAIGVIVVAARIYARVFITKAPSLDDAIIVLALLLAIGSSALATYGAEVLYVGHHIWDVPVGEYSALRLNAWCAQWFYVGALCAVKVSILLFYRRLSLQVSSLFLWATWIGISYNVLGYVTYSLNIVLQCRPTGAYWLASDPRWLAEGHTYTCANIEHIVQPLYCGLSVIGDLYGTTLPLCLVYSLQMSRRQKMSLYFLFALGYVVVGAGIVKTIYVNYLLNETWDSTWIYYQSMIWTTVELYIAIFCASAPGLKPFVKNLFIEITTKNTSSQGQKSGNTLGSSEKKREFIRNRSDAYLKDMNYDEESGNRSGIAVEPIEFDKHEKNDKMLATAHEMDKDRSRYSPIPNKAMSRFEQHSRAQRPSKFQYKHYPREIPSQSTNSNTTKKYNHNSEEPAVVALQILDKPLPPKPPQSDCSSNGWDFSFATTSSSQMPRPKAPYRTSDDGGEFNGSEVDLELPIHGTRENSPEHMRSMTPHARFKYEPS
jgi:hypothetical protein